MHVGKKRSSAPDTGLFGPRDSTGGWRDLRGPSTWPFSGMRRIEGRERPAGTIRELVCSPRDGSAPPQSVPRSQLGVVLWRRGPGQMACARAVAPSRAIPHRKGRMRGGPARRPRRDPVSHRGGRRIAAARLDRGTPSSKAIRDGCGTVETRLGRSTDTVDGPSSEGLAARFEILVRNGLADARWVRARRAPPGVARLRVARGAKSVPRGRGGQSSPVASAGLGSPRRISGGGSSAL